MKALRSSLRRPRGRRARPAFLLFAVLGGAVACGNLTMGVTGEAVVIITGDLPDSISAPAPVQGAWVDAPLPVGGPARADGGEDRPEGQLEAEMRLFLVSAGGTPVSLADDIVEVNVDLEGVEQDETLPREIPADAYAALRIVFLQIEVRVDAGLVIAGDTITGPIEIDLEQDSLVVERPLPLVVQDRKRVYITVDLNAASWLQAVDPVTQSVSGATLAELIAVEVR